MSSLIGNKPNQVPSNGDLGTLAFQDSNAVNISGGTAVIDNLTADAINLKVDTNISNIAPSLNLDFANSKTLDSRITFTRASTATYYDGVTVAKAEENLLAYSQEFDNAYWTKGNTTVAANSTTAPDGTTTAETVTAIAGTNIAPVAYRGSLYSTSGLDYAISFFAKAGTHSAFQITNIGFQSSSAHANFDLSAGTVGTSANCTATIQNISGGWYRCIVVFSATATATNAGAYACLAASTSAARFQNWTPVGTESIYIWGAQLEQRSAVSSYTPTTTQAITNYIPALQTAASGVARFEHNPITGESLGLEIEEARTNLVTYSDDLANAAWTKTASSIASNTIVAPDGTLTGDKIVEDTASAFRYIQQSTASTAQAYTLSFYAKAAERAWCFVSFGSNPSSGSAWFNLSTGVVGTSQANITSRTITAVGNGWYRITATVTSSGATITSRISPTTADNIATYTGDGYKGIYIWGAQLEAGAFATSYIPTVASQVTRGNDVASMTGTNFSSWYRADEGTVYYESQTTQGNGSYPFSLFGSSTSNRIYSSYGSNSIISSGSRVNGTFEAAVTTPTSSAPINTFGKGAVGYKVNDFGFSWNGASALTDTSTTLPTVLEFDIGNNGGLATNWLNGTIKKIAYYPKRLSNQELAEMTA